MAMLSHDLQPLHAPQWFVSLLPIWTGLYLAAYVGADWHVIRIGGYCPLRANPAYDCHGLRAWLSSLLLPAIALGIYFAAIYGRWLAAAFRHGNWCGRCGGASSRPVEIARGPGDFGRECVSDGGAEQQRADLQPS